MNPCRWRCSCWVFTSCGSRRRWMPTDTSGPPDPNADVKRHTLSCQNVPQSSRERDVWAMWEGAVEESAL